MRRRCKLSSGLEGFILDFRPDVRQESLSRPRVLVDKIGFSLLLLSLLPDYYSIFYYKPNVRTNVGKQLISFMASDIWKDLPTPLKKLIQSVSAFPKQVLRYLLSEQQMN